MLWTIFVGCMASFPERNFPPAIAQVNLAEGAVVNYGSNVLFTVDVSDPDTEMENLLLRVESERDGLLFTEVPDENGQLNKSYADLSAGPHLLLIKVSDNTGNTVGTAINITVNSIPQLSGVQLLPEQPATTDDIEATVVQVDDADGDAVTLSYRWFRNGSLQEDLQESVVGGEHTSRDDIWTVEVSPQDQHGQGDSASASVTVVNTPPVLDSVSIDPAQMVTVDTTVTCLASGSDADDDGFSPLYTWRVLANGNFYDYTSESATFVADASLVQPTDQIWCTAQLQEDDGTLSQALSTSVTVINRDPIVSDVLVYVPSGESIRAGATLNCLATVSDPDNSALQLDYVWLNGTTVLGVSNGLSSADQAVLTLTTTNAAREDVLTCQVTARDDVGGEAQGSSSGDVVLNTPPTLQSVGISPLQPTSQDDITCLPVSTDIDDDTVTHEFVWTVNGNPVQTGADDTLQGPFASLDQVTCAITPTDGQSFDGTGNSLSATVTVVNTPPVVTDITFNPSTITTETLVEAVVSAEDIDQDTIELNYDWYVDGTLEKTGGGNSLSGSIYFQRDQQVYVVITPSDALDDGQSITSDILTVENSAPTPSTAEILPLLPAPDLDPLQCIVSTPSDPDGDSVDVSIAWSKNGQPFNDGFNQTVYPNDTVPKIFTADGDQWSCTVELSDGDLSTTTTSALTEVTCLNGLGDIVGCPAVSCLDILEQIPQAYGENGVYFLDPDGTGAFEAYCDMIHDGGGWTLVMKADGSTEELAYDEIYWENTNTLNDTSLFPNVDESGINAKFEAYNSVLGETLRLEFVVPVDHDIHHYNMGTCSDGVATTESDCLLTGLCSDSNFIYEQYCIANGVCSDVSYLDQSDCESNGETWQVHTWTPSTWTLGRSALSLFQGPTITIEESPPQNQMEAGCNAGWLSQDVTSDMMLGYGHQFFGINGSYTYDYTRFSKSLSGTTQIRFGYASSSSSHTYWVPQIGIGLHQYFWRSGDYRSYEDFINGTSGTASSYSYYPSTAWLNVGRWTSRTQCGTYGNGLVVSPEDTASNLWVR